MQSQPVQEDASFTGLHFVAAMIKAVQARLKQSMRLLAYQMKQTRVKLERIPVQDRGPAFDSAGLTDDYMKKLKESVCYIYSCRGCMVDQADAEALWTEASATEWQKPPAMTHMPSFTGMHQGMYAPTLNMVETSFFQEVNAAVKEALDAWVRQSKVQGANVMSSRNIDKLEMGEEMCRCLRHGVDAWVSIMSSAKNLDNLLHETQEKFKGAVKNMPQNIYIRPIAPEPPKKVIVNKWFSPSGVKDIASMPPPSGIDASSQSLIISS
jgi:hypothetical protein